MVQKQVMRKHHVIRRHRRAIGKPRLRAHVENDPGLALVIFKALGQKPVSLAIAVARKRLAAGLGGTKQALVDHPGQAPGPALARIGVHRIKRTRRIKRDFTALGRLGVHVIEMGVIGGVFQIAEIGIAVRGDHVILRQGALGKQRANRQANCGRHDAQARKTLGGPGFGRGVVSGHIIFLLPHP